MLTFAFMHYPYLVRILFGMLSLHLFTFLMFFKSCSYQGFIQELFFLGNVEMCKGCMCMPVHPLGFCRFK